MCKTKNKKSPQQTFLHQVKSFLIANAIMFFWASKGAGVMSWWWLPALIWGIHLANLYFELRQKGEEPRLLTNDQKESWTERSSRPVQKPKEKAWSEKDLV